MLEAERRYPELWKELGERRAQDLRRAAHAVPQSARSVHDVCDLPSHVSTRVIAFMRRKGITREAALWLRTAQSINFATAILPPPHLIEDILALIPANGLNLEDLAQALPILPASARWCGSPKWVFCDFELRQGNRR